MRTLIILALLACTHAYAAEPYPEHAGDKFPVEHWRLQLIQRPCDEQCLADMARTVPGFESYSRTSCISKGIQKMQAAYDAPLWLQGADSLVGFACVFVYEDEG